MNQFDISECQVHHNHTSFFFFSLDCSTSTSKLNVLVNKLHEYLAHSTVEDHNGSPTSQDAHDLTNRSRSVGNSTGHAASEVTTTILVFCQMPYKDLYIDDIKPEWIPNTQGGTVLVRPEPVDNGRDDFRGPEFRSRKSGVLRKEFSRRRGGVEHMGIVSCTACGRQVNHFQRDSFYRHPVLKVLICKSCYKYYSSDDISKDGEGMDEQCRWCAEGGNLICCDFCSNAFCKKCILRNLGRKELSGILESKWYCYVCSPEPLFDLVMACDSVLENMESLWHQQRRKNREEPEKSDLHEMLPHLPQNIPLDKWDHTGMDGNVIFNYNTLQISKDITKKAKHLVDSTNILNRTFVNFIHSVTANKQTPGIRKMYLNSFLSVIKGLRKSVTALEESLKEEFSDLDLSSCWEKFLSDDFDIQPEPEADTELDISDERCLSNLQKLAAEHFDDDDSDFKGFADGRGAQVCLGGHMDSGSHEARQRPQNIALKPSEKGVNMTKKLVVKLTPVPMEQEPSSDTPKIQEGIHMKDKKSKGKGVSGDQETGVTGAKADSKMSNDNCNASVHTEEEQGNRRSPRVKTTPLRRQSDANAKTALLAVDSDSDSDPEETPSTAPAKNIEEQSLSRARDDSDSDEVPAALLERAAISQSSDEPQSDEDGGKASTKVAKKCLFWLTKNTPISPEKIRRKRKMLDRSPESESSNRRVKSRAGSGTDSSSDDQGSQKKNRRKHLNTLRSIGKPHIVKREDEGVARKQSRIQPGKCKTKSCQEAMESPSSSSEAEHDDDSGSDGSDQKMKPITEDVALLGAAAFHQSSGESSTEMRSNLGPRGQQKMMMIQKIGTFSFFSTFERIAKKMLLAQIKANYSSGDDISSDEETQEDESETDGDKEFKQGNEDNGTDENGEDLASEPSDTMSDGPTSRHHLLRHKLSLDEGASSAKDMAQGNVGKQKSKQRTSSEHLSSDSESDGDSDNSVLEDLEMSEELSESEDEAGEDGLKRSSTQEKNASHSYKQKKQVPCIWLSDSSSEKSDREDTEEGTSDTKSTPKGRKKIRKIIEDVNLRQETQEALREEEERCKRLADREQQLEDMREIIVIKDELCPVTTKLILDQDEATKEPLVQVHKNLVTRLKPHQVDGVQFIWNSCCESVKKANSSSGSGCILAHCMGLGKTLQVVTFLHTVLLSENLKFRMALVVCPLNTILNWISEFKKWQDDMGQDKVEVTQLAMVKHPQKRLRALQRWQKEGGVMIMGYEMYRILSQAQKISDEEEKKELKSILVDPGPDFVVCDEGHVLRNESSNISKALNAIRTRRRVVLTGTPLQNNLTEYHCMVNFIKRNLLGSRAEFQNRFINPIQNGQCADSTPRDVRIMKKRAHVLHAMLAGCVQRRDYSELTQFLPPKHEYVLAVRISPLQYQLYRYYLDHFTGKNLSSCFCYGPVHRPHNCGGCTNLPVNLTLHLSLTREQDPEILELLHLRQDLLHPPGEGTPPFFWLRTMASDLEVLILIPAASHSAANCCQYNAEGSWFDEANRTTSSAKSRDEILWFPNWTPSGPWLRLEILSLKELKTSLTEGSARCSQQTLTIRLGLPAVGSTTDKVKQRTGANLFKDFQVLGRIWTHPWCLHLSYISRENKASFENKKQGQAAAPLRNEEAIMAESEWRENKTNNEDNSAVIVVDESTGAPAVEAEKSQNLDKCWFKNLLYEKDAKILENSGKMVLLFEILKMAEELEEKVLVFSQSLITLDLIEDFLEASHNARDPSSLKVGSWIKNIDYYRLDGSTSAPLRKKWTDQFNNPANLRGRLFLISTRAGSLGINLVAANRVIIFDASWNPSYDLQSIYRVYRFGQQNQVFVYRFLAQGTMEEKIYDRQVTKQSLSYRVVDQQQIERHFTLFELTELYTFEPDLLEDPNSKKSKRTTSILPKDKVLVQLLQRCKDQIVSFHEHESLLDHKQEEELSEAERKAAWDEYEAESNTARLAVTLGQDTLETKTNEQLLELLNKSRANVAMAFLSLQKIRSHTYEDYILRVRQQYPLLPEAEVKTKAESWKQWDMKEQERRQASYRDVLAQQQSLTLSIQAILNTRRNQAPAAAVTVVPQLGQI
ncbi:hypothetical protein L3Q82_022139 [Scortum barcoo]|uniref:Uncharacterized protein n=1 Tax=Scortum barcoo TaxID=214431 RepID=A0ACB8X0N9_9TELE|nr:hypothetical protein L3Q82_022139 [Scortum barcoo]